MDAIAGSVSVVILLTTLSLLIFKQDITSIYFIMIVGVLGALIGFLYYNWHPSKIFMGDTGSQFLGIFLAFLGVRYLWNSSPAAPQFINTKNLLLSLVVFILPLIDTTVVVINRLSRKRSPFIGGKDHTTHALAFLGLTDRQVAILFIVISLVSTLIVYIFEKVSGGWNSFTAFIFAAYFLVMLLGFLYLTRLKKS
jgi:UDP-GlcNAc:undecaprenyl-phosphate GlcNAc-1-phosphate transferase